jgi:1-acyl-sn-glycerol-3-phosphate acyltransferase
MAALFSLLYWGFALVSSALLYPLAVVIRCLTSPFDKRLLVLHQFTCFWASLYTWCNPLWRVQVQGKERINPRTTYVMVCNHQSLADIMVLHRLFVHFKWVSKAENFRIPFVGWNMTLNRYIRIERGRLKGTLAMMREAESALRGGSSVMIFPEGTRSPDGALQTFKEGAFELAIRSGAPLLPIVVSGTAAALPKRGFVLRGKQTILLRVLPPIGAQLYGRSNARELATRVHDSMREELDRLRS